MDTILDLLESVDPDSTALVAGEREYSGNRFVQTVYKTGNFLRHSGVHEGAVVEIRPEPHPETIFGLLGTALLGGQITFEIGRENEPSVRLGPTDSFDPAEIPPGCTAIGFGDPPADPSIAYFEREVWSENPFFPEVTLDPAQPYRTVGGRPVSIGEMLESAERVGSQIDVESAERMGGQIGAEAVVALRAGLETPGAFELGVLRPLQVGATVMLPEADQTGTVAVTDDSADAPEANRLDVSEIDVF